MRQRTIDDLADGAAWTVEKVIAENPADTPTERTARLQRELALWISHAVKREVRNDRRRVARRS
ncbi:hypothetical protein ASG63_16345 [Methylobacterium sp. Leaf94]|uniref:hypothetical protein n=1 Tax=Methylobacterium sp. Leaf94 TaxID=1736250 RepID=UPI0006FD2857|nr:hypothetical protein [Methylobacterium sp. Leaf94]KQU31068.1 hypothetical protein ASG63_16345 [Methylobacterium sp. Leaf94]